MKKILLILSAILTLALAQCKKATFLDNKTTGLTEQTVFADSANTMGFLTRIYEDAPFAFNKNRWDSGGLEQGTDDSEFTLTSPARRSIIIANATWTADNFGFPEFWTTPWTNIRRVNLLLSKMASVPLSQARKQLVTGEARFLRAWYYENLIINFGGVPLIGDKVYTVDDDITVPRNTFADCVAYIVSELDAASKLLPTGRNTADFGRITSGACLALKARILLYAASPLFNNTPYVTATAAQTPLIGYGSYDVKRWQDAADAALAVINSGTYSLYVDNTTASGYGFYQVFLNRVNPEFIFAYGRAPNRDFESFYNPPSRGGSKLGQPTQNIVDCFPMKNGKAITDPTSGYNADDPYVNRDPRFGYSIIYNGSLYYSASSNSKQPVFTYVGAPSDGFGNTLTGYYSRKMCDENISNNSSFNTNRSWSLIRYAEILLSYAEAINETGQTQLAYAPMRLLRARAGIDAGADGNYGLKANMSVAEMRTVVQNERHIELFYENSRWDDVRRWKIAMTTQNGFLNYMYITKVGAGYTYKVVNALTQPAQNPAKIHIFYPYSYLLCLQKSEILKNPSMIQNPGY